MTATAIHPARHRQAAALLAVTTTTLLATAVLAPAADAATDRVVVTVRSPAGDPVPGVEVRSTEFTNPGFTGTTGANGRVVFTDVEAGSAGACATLRQDQLLGGTAGWYQACQGFEISGTTRVTLRFTPGAAVSGDVTDARTGASVAAAEVSLFVDGQFLRVTADAAGHYLYRNLQPGLLTRLGVSGAPVSGAAPYGYAGGPEDHITTPVSLRAGAVRSDLDFRVAPNVRWSGTVVDGAGAPVPNAFVAVGHGADEDLAADFTTTTAAANGTFAVLRQWEAGGSLYAWSRGSAARPTGLAVVRTDVATPGTSARRTITLATEGGSLVGRVVRADGGAQPGRFVAVTANIGNPGDFALPGVVQPNGTYRVDGLPAASTQVRAVSNAGGTAYSAQTSAQAGETTTVPKIVLSPAS